MKKCNIFVVGGSTGYTSWIENVNLVDSPLKADIVFFTGGEDVSPSLYGEKTHRTTFANKKRDIVEMEVFNLVKDNPDILKLGVCRGSQFLTVMNGAKLVQNVNNHAIWGGHDIDVEHPEFVGTIKITSTHHQMLRPFVLPDEEYDLIGVSSTKRSDVYQGGDGDVEMPCEPEIVYYKRTNSLGIQGHPEMLPFECETNVVLRKILNYYINK